MSRKRAHAQVLAEWIIDEYPNDVEVTLDQVETMPDDDLYNFCEDWGYSWEGVRGWVDLEDL